ncbi:MAG: DUF1616 domain-containing protein [archaeon]|nr:DUF1616 domain-containing protein [archaeon]MCP8314434.1 DUF1616 domain-containing protein [archaeon]MCP8319360.1 DUF1616 domain-containing protein [archaeon]
MIDEEVSAVALSIIFLIGAFSVSQAFLAGRVIEPFSELAILGPNQKIGDYPKSLMVRENFTLYLYVGNHEGKNMYYRVYVKLGNQSSIINESVPLNAPPMAQYETILSKDQIWLKSITLHMDEPGINYRLVFELWVYKPDEGIFTYHGRWNQIWLNVTSSS